MAGFKLKWYPLFASQQELDELFAVRKTVVHRFMFGEVLLVKNGKNYLAFKNKCPHQGKSLEGSWLEDDQIVCPFHQYHFSLENGRGHGMCLDSFQLRIDPDGVFLGKEVWSLF